MKNETSIHSVEIKTDSKVVVIVEAEGGNVHQILMKKEESGEVLRFISQKIYKGDPICLSSPIKGMSLTSEEYTTGSSSLN